MALVIDKNIPLPPDRNCRGPLGRPTSNEWHLLQIGDSTLVKSNNARCAALQWAVGNGAVFVSRKVPFQGWRIWRIA